MTSIVEPGTVIHPSVKLSHYVRVGRGCIIGENVTLKSGVILAERTVIMPDCRIGRHVIVGACSLVRESIPDDSGIWVGVPCRPLKKVQSISKEKIGYGAETELTLEINRIGQ